MIKAVSTLNVRSAIEDLQRRMKRLENWQSDEYRRLRREKTIMNFPESPRTKSLDLESVSTIFEPPVPKQEVVTVNDNVQAIPPIGKLVYPLLVNWLIEPTTRRIGTWSKIFSASNDVRQILFERQRKAATKSEYEGGLKLESGPDGLIEGVNKLADAVFFFFKFFKQKVPPENRTDRVALETQIKLAEDLITLLTHLANEMKKEQSQ
jgi:hypothetical protein